MTVTVCLPIYAEVDMGMLYMIERASACLEEMEAVEQAVRASGSEWDKYLGLDRDGLSYPWMYQVYYLNMRDMVSAYGTDGSFGSNISDKYYWVVPIHQKKREVQVVHSEQSEYGWAIRRGTYYQNDIETSYPDVAFDIVSMNNCVFKEHPNADKESIRLVKEDGFDMHIMYFTDGGEEYVVPFFASTEITWVKNGVAYPARDFIELVRENSGDDSGYVPVTKPGAATETLYLNYVVIGTLAVIFVAATALIVAKYKKGNNK